ncbi:MAG: DMT family protein [Alphaproteobacteria bacterium]
MASYLYPIGLLLASNLFMTFAWYGHLKFKAAPLGLAILASWGIAFFEYCLAVPANRIGHGAYTLAQLKTIQEVVTLTVFIGVSYFWLGEAPTVKTLAGFALICIGAGLIFHR